MKIKHFFIGIFACAICTANFVFGVDAPNGSSDLTLQNIEAVGLSAAESTCEGTNKVDCYTYNENGMLAGKSKGPLRTNN